MTALSSFAFQREHSDREKSFAVQNSSVLLSKFICRKPRQIANYWLAPAIDVSVSQRWVAAGVARCTIDKYALTDIPCQPCGERRRLLHGRTTFDTDSARPCVPALIAGARPTRRVPPPPPPHKSAGDDGPRGRAIVRAAYTMVSDECRCAPCGSRPAEDTIWFSAYGRARRVQRSRAYSSS